MSTTADVSCEEGRTGSNWTVSSLLLLTFGLSLIIVGSYFWFVRPPLLPEDLRFLAASSAEINATVPNLKVWLAHVFRVLGGHIVGCGILTIALAQTSYREHRTTAAIAAGAAGAASIGLMTAVNFSINSDFKWILSVIALLWAFSIITYIIEALRSPAGPNGGRVTSHMKNLLLSSGLQSLKP